MYCMWRDEEVADGGKEDEDGLIKCYSVLLWYITIYLTGVDEQRRLAVPIESKLSPFLLPTFPAHVPSLIGTLA